MMRDELKCARNEITRAKKEEGQPRTRLTLRRIFQSGGMHAGVF